MAWIGHWTDVGDSCIYLNTSHYAVPRDQVFCHVRQIFRQQRKGCLEKRGGRAGSVVRTLIDARHLNTIYILVHGRNVLLLPSNLTPSMNNVCKSK